MLRDHVAGFASEHDECYAKGLGNFLIERISRIATRSPAFGDNPLSPSCSQKPSLLFSEYLDEHLLLALPHRQFSLPPPKALRVFLRCDQRLFGRISRLISSLIAEFYSTAATRPVSRAAIYILRIHVTARLALLLRQRTVSLFLKLGPNTE